jgi:hypothetical protein
LGKTYGTKVPLVRIYPLAHFSSLTISNILANPWPVIKSNSLLQAESNSGHYSLVGHFETEAESHLQVATLPGGMETNWRTFCC